jgi:UDP-GlcNAc:undecaprenyl-phosphate/decaprenyl-phosphate GlcNAc-1-phosphate transferase
MFLFIIACLMFGFALLISTAVTPFVRRLSQNLDIQDAPDESRKMHPTHIPTLGGIAIFLGFLLSLLWGATLEQELFYFITTRFSAVLLGGAVILLTGILDDVFRLDFRSKFFMQIIAATLTIGFSGQFVQSIPNPFGASLPLPVWLGILLTATWIIGVCNAVNLIDGMDGLAGGVSSIALMGFAVLSIAFGDSALMLISLGLLGAIVGFLRHNVYPARIFMGDTGALFIGFILSTIPLFGSRADIIDTMLCASLFFLAFPILDTLIAPLRRLISRTHPFKPDKEHIHHRFQRIAKLTHKQTVIGIYIVSLGFMFTGLGVVWLLKVGETNFAALLLSGTVMLTLYAIKKLGYFTRNAQLPVTPDASKASRNTL